MDRIELIRRLNGVLLDEMPAYRDRARPGSRTTCDLRCITKKYRGARLRLQRKLRTKHLRQKNGLANAQVRFLYLLRLSQSGLSSHSEAVSPEKALLEPAA